MNTSKHTPGPWYVTASDPDGGMIVTEEETITYWPCNDLDSAENMANARLIAAAPDMRAALNSIHAELDGKEWSSDTLDNVAAILRDAGYSIAGPDEE